MSPITSLIAGFLLFTAVAAAPTPVLSGIRTTSRHVHARRPSTREGPLRSSPTPSLTEFFSSVTEASPATFTAGHV